jgi:hypothetical protein
MFRIIKRLFKNPNKCYHKWKFTNYCWCQECSDFYRAKLMKKGWYTHGTIVSQCVKCGILFEKEYGIFPKESIQNFKFNKTKIPHLKRVLIKGI